MEDSYSIPAIGLTYLGSATAGYAMAGLAGGALIALSVLFGRQGDDARSLICALAASLALTPVVWQHYLVLLVVPLALSRPRFSALWLLPLLLWLSPRAGHGDGVVVVLPLVVMLVIVVAILVRPRNAPPLQGRVASVAR
jgi:hypothetical protein